MRNIFLIIILFIFVSCADPTSTPIKEETIIEITATEFLSTLSNPKIINRYQEINVKLYQDRDILIRTEKEHVSTFEFLYSVKNDTLVLNGYGKCYSSYIEEKSDSTIEINFLDNPIETAHGYIVLWVFKENRFYE